MQLTIVYFIVAIAIGYAASLIFKSFKNTNNPCQGCQGCALKKQMLKKNKNKESVFECYIKKR